MKLYIVTETNCESNILLRSWVCFTHEQAARCLDYHYDVACSYNSIAGTDAPIDCRDADFFYHHLQNGMSIRYDIQHSETFEK